jgi:hypothetical protein
MSSSHPASAVPQAQPQPRSAKDFLLEILGGDKESLHWNVVNHAINASNESSVLSSGQQEIARGLVRIGSHRAHDAGRTHRHDAELEEGVNIARFINTCR